MRKLLGKILALIGGVSLGAAIGYWLFNPELTEMQIFLKLWYVFILSIIALVGGLAMNSDDELIF